MVQISQFDGEKAILIFEAEEKNMPELSDYNPFQDKFLLERQVIYKTSLSRHCLKELIQKNQGACIYNTITHNPPEGLPAYKVLLYGEPFIDVFGLYVYTFSTLAWGPRSDVDLRFNANHYPYNIIDPELGFLFT